jgi:hypothetical protein
MWIMGHLWKLTDEQKHSKLNELLQRREKYFLLPDFQRTLFREQFEEMQKEILWLKVMLKVYHDELDILELRFNYKDEDYKLKMYDEAIKSGEIKGLGKSFSPSEGYIAVYTCLVLKQPSDPWIAEEYMMQQLRREGWISCPWATRINRMEDGGGNE